MKLLQWIALTAIVATGTFKSNAAPIAFPNTNSTGYQTPAYQTVSLGGKTPPRREKKLQNGAGAIVSHLAGRNDGTTWLTWFEQPRKSENYSIRLQRLNTNGRRMLGSKGVPASSVDSVSWVMDYGLATDNDGNAVLVYSNTKDYVLRAQQFDPQGIPRWGASGVVMSATGAKAYVPNALRSSDGGLVIAWVEAQEQNGTETSASIRMMRMKSTGEFAWNAPFSVEPAQGNTMGLSQIAGGGDGSAILVWTENAGVNLPGDVYAQRIDKTGKAAWPQVVKVSGTNQLPYANNPAVVADGNGGIYLAWTAGAIWSRGWVQHLDQDGHLLWADGGVLVSTRTDTMQFPRAITCLPAENRIVVAWQETDYYQNLVGISAQSFDAQATPLWAATGLVVTEAGTQATYAGALRPTPTGVDLFYTKEGRSFPKVTAHVASISTQPGATPVQTTLSRIASEKTDPVVSDLVGGGYWLVWAKSRSGLYGVFWSGQP